jgi:hypothetical protein
LLVKRRFGLKDTKRWARLRLDGRISPSFAWLKPFCHPVAVMCLVAGVGLLTPAGAQPSGKVSPHSFGLYLPAEVLPPAQVAVRGADDLSRIPLATTPVISDADILSYDFGQHLMKLRPEAVERLSRLLVDRPNSAFVAVADGAPVYLGAFERFDSLELTQAPTIITDWQYEDQPADTVAVLWPFPPGSASRSTPDPRASERIKSVLAALNKLQGQGTVFRGVVARSVAMTNAAPVKMAHYLAEEFMKSSAGSSSNRTESSLGGSARADGEAKGPQPSGNRRDLRPTGRVLLVGDPRNRSVLISAPPVPNAEMAVFIRELDARPFPEVWPDGTLGQEQARALAQQLANEKARAAYGVEPFRDGPDPTWVGRWVWGDVRNIEKGQIQALVSFGANGSNRVASVSPFRNQEKERGPSLGF